MGSINSLADVLQEELRDLMSAEKQLLKALPKIAKAAQAPALSEAIKQHLEETEQQVKRLEQIEEMLGMKLSGKTCQAMKGLIEEGDEIIKMRNGSEPLIDVLLIGACQRVEHYEIAGYGTARTLAEYLGLEDVAQLLQESLDEEGNADRLLTEVCEEELLPQWEEEVEAEDVEEEEEEEYDEDEDAAEETMSRPRAREAKGAR